MKLIIAGSRDFTKLKTDDIDYYLVSRLNVHPSRRRSTVISEVVSGMAKGVDTAGLAWANSYEVPIKDFPYKREFGKAGGPIRNKQMAEYADALLLIWDGESRGSANMKKEMLALDKPVYEVVLRSYNNDR